MKAKALFILFFLILSCDTSAIAQWSQVFFQQSSGIVSFYSSGSKIFAGSADGYDPDGILISTNNGISWSIQMGKIHSGVPAIATQENNLYVAIGDGIFTTTSFGYGLLRSTDDGYSWMPINRGLLDTTIRSLAIIGTDVFAGGRRGGGVFRSTDSGATWTAVNMGLSNTTITCLAVTDSILYAGTAGGLLQTTNRGDSWTGVYVGWSSPFVRAMAVNGSHIIVSLVQPYPKPDTIFLSSDNGETWKGLSTGYIPKHDLTNTVVGALAFSGPNIFGAISDATGIVFASTDNGASWSDINNGGPVRVDALAISGPNLIAGSGVIGIWVAPLSDFTAGVSATGVQEPIELSPNPTPGIITIHADNASHVTLENLLGERVLEVANPRASEFTLDLSKLPAGLYFARFELASGPVEMRKVVKE